MAAKFNELIKSEVPVLVDFFADWCGPCHTMAPVMEKLAKSKSGKMKVIKVNVDKNPGAASKFGVRSIPTFILFEKGQVKWRKAGVIPFKEFENEMTKFVG